MAEALSDMIAEMKRLTEASRVLEPGSAILRALSPFQKVMSKDLDEPALLELSDHIIKLMYINAGKIPTQASIILGSCLCDVYERARPNYGIVLSSFMRKLTPVGLIVIGQICQSRGPGCEIVSQVVEALHGHPNRYQTIYALRCAFKGYACDLKNLAEAVLRNVVLVFSGLSDVVQMIAVKLIKRLLRSDVTIIPAVVQMSEDVIGVVAVFVRMEVVTLCARCARLSDITQAVIILARIRPLASSVVQLYIEKLDASFILKESDILFKFMMEHCPVDLKYIVPFLSRSAKDDLHKKVLGHMWLPDISSLLMLHALDVDRIAVTTMALKLAASTKVEERDCALKFFRESNRKVQLGLLRSGLDMLCLKFEVPLYLVIKVFCAEIKSDESFDRFVEVALSRKDYENPMLWTIIDASRVRPNMIDVVMDQGRSPLLVEPLLRYFARNPSAPQSAAYITSVIHKLEYLDDSELVALADVNVVSDRIGYVVLEKILRSKVSKQFLMENASQPMALVDDLATLLVSVPVVTETEVSAQKLIEKFPVIYRNCTFEMQCTILSMILSTVSRESHVLLIHMWRAGVVRLTPNRLYASLTGTDYLRMQVTAEMIAICGPTTDEIAEQCEAGTSGGLLMLAACCRHVHFPRLFLRWIISKLDSFVANVSLSPFAMHALANLLNTHLTDFIAFGFDVNVLSKMLCKMNGELSLMPALQHFVARVVENVVPVVSCYLMNKEIWWSLIAILETIRVSPFDLARKIYYELELAVLTHAPQMVGQMKYYTTWNASIDTKIAAAKFMTVFVKLGGKVSDPDAASNLIMLIYKTGNRAFCDCLTAIASIATVGVVEYKDIAHDVLVRNIMPGLPTIEPSRNVKLAVLDFLPVIVDAYPHHSMLCVAKAIESGYVEEGLRLMAIIIRRLRETHGAYIESISKQLGTVLECACHCNIAHASDFLLAFLSERSLPLYLACWRLSEPTAEYVLIVTRICCLASDVDAEDEKFAHIVYQTLKGVTKRALSESLSKTSFRTFAFNFYPYLFRAMIWSASQLQKDCDVASLSSFFLSELGENCEKCRVQSALSGGFELMVRFGVGVEFTKAFVTAVASLSQEMQVLLKREIGLFGYAVITTSVLDTELTPVFHTLIRSAVPTKKVIESMIKDPEFVRKSTSELTDHIISAGCLAYVEKLDLLERLTRAVPKVSQLLSALTYANEHMSFHVYMLCIKYGDGLSMDRILAFAMSYFRTRGVALAEEAICIGGHAICLLPKLINAACRAFVSGEDFPSNLLCSFVEKFGSVPSIAEAMANVALQRHANGGSIVLIRKINEVNGELMQLIWNRMDDSTKTALQDKLRDR